MVVGDECPARVVGIEDLVDDEVLVVQLSDCGGVLAQLRKMMVDGGDYWGVKWKLAALKKTSLYCVAECWQT